MATAVKPQGGDQHKFVRGNILKDLLFSIPLISAICCNRCTTPSSIIVSNAVEAAAGALAAVFLTLHQHGIRSFGRRRQRGAARAFWAQKSHTSSQKGAAHHRRYRCANINARGKPFSRAFYVVNAADVPGNSAYPQKPPLRHAAYLCLPWRTDRAKTLALAARITRGRLEICQRDMPFLVLQKR